MKVLILGFDNYKELDNKMEELIAESGNYLFAVAAGGLSGQTLEESLSAKWAKDKGAPLYWITAGTGDELIRRMVQECDYVVMKITSSSPQWHKNLLMQFKKAGKHGTVVR